MLTAPARRCSPACRSPLVWDPVNTLWAHLRDRSPCSPPGPAEQDFRHDPIVKLAAELMDPLYGVEIPPARFTAAQIIERAERDRALLKEYRMSR
jgi:hypothetical protein